MPIYEYRCDACGHELERLQRISDAPLKKCPDCGKNKLRRLVSAAGFRLKGGGWYETDFKKDGKRNLHDSHSAKTQGGESSGGSSSGGEKKEAAKPAETKKSSSDTASSKSGSS